MWLAWIHKTLHLSLATATFLILFFITYCGMNAVKLYAIISMSLGFVFVYLVSRFAFKIMSVTQFLIVLFTISFVVKFIFVLNAHFVPTDDFGLIYEAARKMATGNLEDLHNHYFQTWAYQTSMVIYEAVLMKIFAGFTNSSILLFKTLNCIYLSLTAVFIYALSRKFASEAASRSVAIFYAVCPVTLPLLPIITNQHPANALIFGAITLLAHKRGGLFVVVAAVLIALGDAFRPIGIIPIGAIITMGLLQQRFKTVAIVVGTYLIVSQLLSFSVAVSGINQNGLSNQFPEWKFVLGLNLDSGGGYTREDVYVYDITDSDERSDLALQIINERLSHWQQFPRLFIGKLRVLFTDSEYYVWNYGRLSGTKPYVIIGELCLAVIPLVAALSCVGAANSAFLALKRDMKGAEHLVRAFVMLLFIFYVGAHLLIEVQPRYRDFTIPIMFVLSSAAFDIFEPVAKDLRHFIIKCLRTCHRNNLFGKSKI